jgi:hypothetical protein
MTSWTSTRSVEGSPVSPHSVRTPHAVQEVCSAHRITEIDGIAILGCGSCSGSEE